MFAASRNWLSLIVLTGIVGGCEDAGRAFDPDAPGHDGDVQPTSDQRDFVTVDQKWAHLAQHEILGWGGFFYENGDAVVQLTDPTNAAARQAAKGYIAGVRSARGDAPIDVIVREAKYDFNQLNDWRDRFHALLPESTVVLVDADESSNRVRIGVADHSGEEMARQWATENGVPAAALAFETIAPIEPRLNLRDHDRPVKSGFQIVHQDRASNAYCSLGFNAVNEEGYLGFVTASHCSPTLYDVDSGWMAQSEQAATQAIGYEWTDPPLWFVCGWTHCRFSDAAFYRYQSGVNYDFGKITRTEYYSVGAAGSLVVASNKPFWEISGKIPHEYQQEGDSLYKIGRTTGWTLGYVQNTCVDWFELRCQFETDIYSQPGDSGAPIVTGIDVLNYVGLWGTLVGGPPGDWNTTFYSAVDWIDYELGDMKVCLPAYSC